MVTVREWIDFSTGYMCTLAQNTFTGHYCGYVAIPETHPLYGNASCFCDAPVHGGVTFTDFGVAVTGDFVWIVGFDCGQSCDYLPLLKWGNPKNFKDQDYVIEETNKLAEYLGTRS